MEKIQKILQSDKKHKEKVTSITKEVLKDKDLVKELFGLLENGSKVERGTAAEVMKFVSQEKPELFKSHIDTLVEYIDYDAPRVKWGVPETLGHLAKKYPAEVEKAIPKLMENAKDKSTVIRWCAAFALGEIAKHSKKVQKDLVMKFQKIVKLEKNNGVKNVYVKALKEIGE